LANIKKLSTCSISRSLKERFATLFCWHRIFIRQPYSVAAIDRYAIDTAIG